MSVVLRSCFSYQVAAGSTTSLKIVVDVCRKSRLSSRSSLPSGASSTHVMSRGRLSGGVSVARTEEVVPSRCLRKYSLPLAEEPSRLARHTARIRGKFSGASGFSPAKCNVPSWSCSTTCSTTGLPAAAASSQRSSGLRSNVGYDGIQPIRALFATTSAVPRPAS